MKCQVDVDARTTQHALDLLQMECDAAGAVVKTSAKKRAEEEASIKQITIDRDAARSEMSDAESKMNTFARTNRTAAYKSFARVRDTSMGTLETLNKELVTLRTSVLVAVAVETKAQRVLKQRREVLELRVKASKKKKLAAQKKAAAAGTGPSPAVAAAALSSGDTSVGEVAGEQLKVAGAQQALAAARKVSEGLAARVKARSAQLKALTLRLEAAEAQAREGELGGEGG